ncbi:MAG: hypothetical protein JWQ03_519, partial [Variovorax sp.]|nr:hypothetical protein [Variovorax sp.]
SFFWPIIAIHAVLTPNGQVMTYGSGQDGSQGAQLIYDVWDLVSKAHTLLSNTTGTDIFCNVQLVLPGAGQALLAGGGDTREATGGNIVNRGVNDVNLFDAATRTLAASVRR